MAAPTQEQLKTLEQSRQRLVQLTRSLASLITSLNQSDPLPSWYVYTLFQLVLFVFLVDRALNSLNDQ